MPWQVIVETVRTDGSGLSLGCVVTDGVSQKIQHSFVFNSGVTLESVKATIQQYIDTLTAIDTLGKLIQPGVLDLTTKQDPPINPTPAQIWAEAFGRLRVLKELVDLGVIPIDGDDYAAQLKTVASTFDPSFV